MVMAEVAAVDIYENSEVKRPLEISFSSPHYCKRYKKLEFGSKNSFGMMTLEFTSQDERLNKNTWEIFKRLGDLYFEDVK